MVGLVSLLAWLVIAQVGGSTIPSGSTIVLPPPDNSHTGSTTVQQTQNVFPAPSRTEVIDTEKEAAPVILQSGLQGINKSGASDLDDMFKLALQLSHIRKDLILLPVVQDLNKAMTRIVVASLSLVLAALCVWGLISRAVGSDSREAFDYLARVPLWCLLALTSIQWYGLILDAFTALAGVIATSSEGAFGPTLRPDFWDNVGVGIFEQLVGLFMLINLLLFALQIFVDTAFLAFCGIVAPVFIFLKTTPWTSHWGSNWFRMVPATAGDLLAMVALLVIGAAAVDLITAKSTFQTIGLLLGLLLCLPLIRKLFGLEGHTPGARLIQGWLFARFLRGRTGGAAPATTTATSPTRAPRWGTAATNKGTA